MLDRFLSHTIKIVFLISFFLILFSFSNKTYAATRTWDGGGGVDTNWSNCANWDGPNICPVAGDTAQFNATSTNNSTIDSGFGGSIGVISIATTYSGTITLGETLAVTSTFTQSGGIWDSSNQALSISGVFTLNNAGATFKASSGTTTFAGQFNITAGTFTHNSGIINFTGSNSISCNNTTLNLVTFNNTGTRTVNSDCNLPLGNDPTLGNSANITLNGTLSGTGKITMSTFTLTLNAGAGFSGFNSAALNGLTVQGATIDFSSYSPFSATTFSETSGTITFPSGTTLNATTISGGTFNAPAENLTFNLSLSISGSPIFNANGGTITFAGGGSNSLSCNNVSFNLVVFTNTGTRTVNSDCSLPLGNNPTISNTVTLNGGTLSGTGTLTTTTGTFTIQNGGILSGFSGLVTGGAFTMSATTASTSLDLTSYTTASFGNNFTLNTPTNPFTNTFTAPTGTMSVARNFTINSGTTFTANGGTVNFNGGGGILSCGNVAFNLVTITASFESVSSNCSLPLGNNPTITSIDLFGTLLGSGTINMSASSTLYFESGYVLAGFSGLNIDQLALVNTTADFSALSQITTSYIYFSGVTSMIAPATFTLNTTFAVLILGYSSNTFSFNANGGTFILSPAAGVTSNTFILPAMQFNNLIANSTIDATIRLTGDISVDGTLMFTGTKDHLLKLRSGVNGVQRNINASGSRTLSNLDVKDMNNINSQVMSGDYLIDSGNNTGWIFSASSINLQLDKPGDASYINETHPTFKWKRATSITGKTITGYTLKVDNGDTGNWQISDIPITGSGDINTSKYTAHYDGFTDSDPNNDYIYVYTHDSSAWNSSENNGKLKEGLHRWYVTATDNTGNSVTQTRTVLVDTTAPIISLTKYGSFSLSSQFSSIKISSSQPTLYGTITDSTANKGTRDETVSSGPTSILASLDKQVADGRFINLTTTIVPIYDMFLADTGQKVYSTTYSTQDKYSPFSYTPPYTLTSGTYKVSFSGVDAIGNTGNATTITLVVPSAVPQVADTVPSPPPLSSSDQSSAQFVPTVSQISTVPSPTLVLKPTESSSTTASKHCIFGVCF